MDAEHKSHSTVLAAMVRKVNLYLHLSLHRKRIKLFENHFCVLGKVVTKDISYVIQLPDMKILHDLSPGIEGQYTMSPENVLTSYIKENPTIQNIYRCQEVNV